MSFKRQVATTAVWLALGAPAGAQTQCQLDSVLANPEVNNPPSCAALWNDAQGHGVETEGPFFPTPTEIRVSINPSIWNTDCNAACTVVGTAPSPGGVLPCCNATPGFGGGHLSVNEAERLMRSHFSLFHSKTGSRLSYRWVGRTPGVTEYYCEDQDPLQPPTVNIMSNDWLSKTGQGSRWVKPNDAMQCALMQFRLVTEPAGSPLNWAWCDPANQPPGTNCFPRVLRHETGHTLGLQHQACAPVGSPPEDDHSATTGGCDFDGEQPPPGLIHEPVHMADQRYFRIDYGVMGYVIRDAHGAGFAPPAWDAPQIRPGVAGWLASPVSVADSDSTARGFAYNVWDAANYTSTLAVTLFENGTWKLEKAAANGWTHASWSRPDITRSFSVRTPPQTPHWMVAFLEGATPQNSGSRYPSVAERPHGGGPNDWVYTNLQSLVPTTVTDPKGNRSGFDSVAVTYDPRSARYLLVWVEREMDPATDDTEAIKMSTRLATDVGGAWTTPQTVATTRTSDGADLACSKWEETTGPGYNCLLVWAHGYSGQILYRRFEVGATGVVSIPASSLAYGSMSAATGYHRPSVTVNPLGGAPQFRIAYTDWNADGHVFTAVLQSGGTFAQSSTTFTLPISHRYQWFGPPGLAAYVEDGETQLSLTFGY
jgi:hypothetical protein